MSATRPVTAQDSRDLTDVVTQLRRTLRRSIRSDYPWEARPMAQIEVLQSLNESGASRVGDLADRLRLAQSTVSALVGKLIGAGLVTRDVDSVDRRASVVALTAAGRADLRKWDTAHRNRLGKGLRSLSGADRATVLGAVGALSRLVDALDASA